MAEAEKKKAEAKRKKAEVDSKKTAKEAEREVLISGTRGRWRSFIWTFLV